MPQSFITAGPGHDTGQAMLPSSLTSKRAAMGQHISHRRNSRYVRGRMLNMTVSSSGGARSLCCRYAASRRSRRPASRRILHACAADERFPHASSALPPACTVLRSWMGAIWY